MLEVAGAAAHNRAERGTFLLPFEACQRVELRMPKVVNARRWRHAARHALGNALPDWSSLRAASAGTFDLYPYQLAPARSLARGEASRFLIADAVGLGKTVQAALMIAETLARWPSRRAIVVCPAGLRDQWHDELTSRFAVACRVIDASSLATLTQELPSHINPWAIQDVVITSIDYIKRPEVMRALEGLVWDIAVFDEAHNLVTGSDRSTAAALIATRARSVVLLTATPHSGDRESFERLCGIGQLGKDPIRVFHRTRSSTTVQRQTCSRFLRVTLSAEERRMHDALLAYARALWANQASAGARLLVPLLLRRASSSASSLARSIERRMQLLGGEANAGAVQRNLPYESDDAAFDMPLAGPGLADAASEAAHLEDVLEAAQMAAARESKVDALRRLLRRIAEPAIVFTEYRDTLEHVARTLGGAQTLVLHGGLPPRQRRDVIRRFTSGASRLLVSTDTGSEGLNLHHRCRVVVNLEIPWMPRRIEQRGGRVDRIGQTRRVHLVHLVAGGTYEEGVLARLVERQLRSHHTLQRLNQVPESEIARAVVESGHPAEDPDAELPPGVIPAGDDPGAHTEAVRIHVSRNMQQGATGVPGTVLASVRRRRTRHTPRRCFWLFTRTCAGGDLVFWEAPFALTAESSCRERSYGRLRRLLAPATVTATDAIRECQDAERRRLRRELERPLRLWRTREEAIRDLLLEHDANLAPALIQAGLFDRRMERHVRARRESLDHALSRCDQRLVELDGLSRIDVSEPVCLFGLLRE